ncbi:MAG: hypothetical protein KZQ65_10050 [Candidatus Thiodiazotropha sp. (ex Gloverina cf. vestifex)]|nr:hypothetical protein [Candidatus Thiodiazotropha sp. (ex Gloverina cf. vestifex)]
MAEDKNDTEQTVTAGADTETKEAAVKKKAAKKKVAKKKVAKKKAVSKKTAVSKKAPVAKRASATEASSNQEKKSSGSPKLGQTAAVGVAAATSAGENCRGVNGSLIRRNRPGKIQKRGIFGGKFNVNRFKKLRRFLGQSDFLAAHRGVGLHLYSFSGKAPKW